jgi:hypothetical protein
MATVKEIIRRNNETFYDYRSKKGKSPYARFTSFVIIGAVVATFFNDLGDGFLNAVLAVQSILVGFSFSVLFFLVSGSITLNEVEYSREKKYRVERLNTLATELFYNVAYYNTVAIGSVVVALLFLLPNLSIFPSFVSISAVQAIAGSFSADAFDQIVDVTSRLLTFIFVFLFTDSIFTFFRIVRRVNFFFSEKLILKS